MDSLRRKSSYSGGGGGNCVAVGTASGAVFVEDTKQDQQAERDRLRVSARAWVEFLTRMAQGH